MYRPGPLDAQVRFQPNVGFTLERRPPNQRCERDRRSVSDEPVDILAPGHDAGIRLGEVIDGT